MDWSLLPILMALVVGTVGFLLMCTAFALIALKGGWTKALPSEGPARWSLPRRLLVAGATLGALFGVIIMILFMVPGGIPWIK